MSNFVHLGGVGTGVNDFDVDVSEVLFLDRSSGRIAVALNGQFGGMTSFDVASNGALDMIMSRAFQAGTRDFQTVQSTVISVYGKDFIVTGASNSGSFYGYFVDAAGVISDLTVLPATTSTAGAIVALVPLDSDGSIAQVLTLTEEGSVQLRFVTDAGESLGSAQTIDLFQADIAHLEVAYVDGSVFFFVSEYLTGDVVSYRYDADTQTAQETGRGGATTNVGLGTPTDLATLTLEGITYVVVASSESQSLSLFELQLDGSLIATDHVLDTLHTLFGRANLVETFDVNGTPFIIAAGGDAGVSLFTMLPSGRLVLIENYHAWNGAPLVDLASLKVVLSGQDVFVYLTSETQAGVISMAFDAAAWSAPQYDNQMSSTLEGTALNDVIAGGGGDDILRGLAGDDVLSDGRGSDQLYGGSGADVFVMKDDGANDTISDFEVGVDRVDVSDYVMTYAPDQLQVTALSGGMTIWFGSERLDILSSSGYELTVADVFGPHFINPDRPYISNVGEILGTPQNDTLVGTRLSDYIMGLLGDDMIYGGEGSDAIDGGGGDDVLQGEAGSDLLHGQAGNDTLLGGDDSDRVYGGDGNDGLHGQDGADLLYGEDGEDVLNGDEGDDRVYGGSGNDDLEGGNGHDIIKGDSGRDAIRGGTGQDSIWGGKHGDRAWGGDGNDTLYGEDGDDRVYGENGDDRVDGNDGDDRVYGDGGNDWLHGDAGNDLIWGGDGADRAYGGIGDDRIFGENDDDLIYGEDGDDLMNGNAGNDRIYGGNGNDDLSGDIGDDFIKGDNGNDLIHGDAGNDTIYGGRHGDRAWGGDGDDSVYGGAGDDRVYGENGDDRVDGNAGNDRVYGDAGFDWLHGNEGDDMIWGGDDGDRAYGGIGNDRIFGENGNDLLYGEDGDDILNGDAGRDHLYGGAGQDALNGGLGNDILKGDAGADQFIFQQSFGHDDVLDFDLTQDTLVFDINGFSVETLTTGTNAEGALQLTYMESDVANTITLHDLSLSDYSDIDILLL
ncbi:MAG: hypothetical protein ABF285_03980 [Pacificibacter sp.]|uniref:calcium-binding protein n=1 Tax=Pacificibacter sp. TaxID=1917866 RepID=UPI003219B98A